MGEKKQINYKFIPTSLFRGRPLIRDYPDEWATTKQACRDELVVYLFFFCPIYSSLYFHVLSTVLRTSSFTLHIYIYIFTITAEINARSLVNFYRRYADRHMNLKFI